MKWWSRWVPPPYELACRASALLVCHDPMKIGKSPWCCPRQAEFWRLCCTSWCAAYWRFGLHLSEKQMCIQEIGAVAGSRTRTCALARRHSPPKSQPRKLKGQERHCTPGPCHFNKEQTPLATLRYQPTVSRWFFRCFGAHLLPSP